MPAFDGPEFPVPPETWRDVVSEEFDRSTTTSGGRALDLRRWAIRGAETIEAGGGVLRLHWQHDAALGRWRAGRITARAVLPGAFHCRVRLRCSHADLPGLGAQVAAAPVGGTGQGRWDLALFGGAAQAGIGVSVRTDRAGIGPLGAGTATSSVAVACDATQWHIIDARRTVRRIAGVPVGTLRWWLDGRERGLADGLWIDNAALAGPLAFTAAALVTDPAAPHLAGAFLALDYVRLWAPG